MPMMSSPSPVLIEIEPVIVRWVMMIVSLPSLTPVSPLLKSRMMLVTPVPCTLELPLIVVG